MEGCVKEGEKAMRWSIRENGSGRKSARVAHDHTTPTKVESVYYIQHLYHQPSPLPSYFMHRYYLKTIRNKLHPTDLNSKVSNHLDTMLHDFLSPQENEQLRNWFILETQHKWAA